MAAKRDLNTYLKWACIAVGAALVIGVIFGIATSSRTGSGVSRHYCTNDDAKVEARIMVKRSLKNPDAADFSNSTGWDVQRGADSVFTVTGEVSSTNSFNAVVRQRFAARVLCTPTGWRHGPVNFQ